MVNDRLDSLKARRTVTKSSLTRFKTFLAAFNIETSEIEDLKARLNKIRQLLDTFISIEGEIFSLEKDEVEYDDEILGFENSFFAAIALANKIIKQKEALIQVPISNEQSRATIEGVRAPSVDLVSFPNQVKLPTISIPSFCGSYDKWLNFRDTYSSLIHNHATLSKIEKFHYLRSALTGEAADQILSLETTEANYDTAWDLLKERYENQGLIISSHLDAIFSISPLQKESYLGLRQLHANVEKHLRSLKALGLPVDKWDVLIMHIMAARLDPVTLRDWKGFKCEDKVPTLKEMFGFLNDRCQVLQSIKREDPKIDKNVNSSRPRQSSKALLATDNEARKLNLCLNCLKRNHKTRDCRNKLACNICNKRHNSILHLEFDNEQKVPDAPEISASTIVAACSSNEPRKKILLATALVKLVDGQGQSHEVRALLDSASQSNFVTQSLCDRLGLNSRPVHLNVSGIGPGVTKINKRVSVSIHSRLNSFKANLSCLVLSQITSNIPGVSFDCEGINIPDDLVLADPEFNLSAPVDILIGASLFWDLLCQGQVRLGHDLPIMQKTYLGWIVSGPLLIPKRKFENLLCHMSLNDSVDRQLREFWEVEERFVEHRALTPTEEICESHFKSKTFRAPNGQFVVSIPFKFFGEEMLGDSREMALNRFHLLERKLNKSTLLREQYNQFMQEYLDLGHMSEVRDVDSDRLSYYLPHHPIIRPTSLTTKLRVVFDASAKTTNGKSLNDVQLVGPTIQRDIFSILLAFRKYPYAFTADIAKMYRMVLINNDDRVFQRIFWRFDISLPIKCYELNTVTYGTASASFLAIRCLNELAQIHKESHPLISEIIESCFSVDDVLSGADNLEDLIYIQRELSRILASAGFDLRKWSSNNREFLNAIDNKQDDDKNFIINSAEGSRALGLSWDRGADEFSFCVDLKIKGSQITKRQILSCIAQIFDPLGLITPITTVVKVILQRLWQLGLSWDEAIPLDLRTKWISIKDSLVDLNKVQVPRFVICKNHVGLELHAFCDASETAYGCCVYIRSIDECSNVTVRLLASKGRVAPLKKLSVPRLELCAAVILSQLVVKVRDSLNLNFDAQYFWSDSTVTLAWIRGCPSRWKTFVANRVSEIRGNVGISDWRHVSGAENPADLLSRGLEPKNIINNKLWWHGPEWLIFPIDEWPSNGLDCSEDFIPEQKVVALASVLGLGSDLFSKFSNFLKLCRVMAYCLRFLRNTRLKCQERVSGCLTVKEMNLSTLALVKLAQNEKFSNELLSLSAGRDLHRKSKLLPLSPFLCDNILRVGGRLKNSNYEFDKKHPILLPKGHRLTKLIIKHEHERLSHAGPQAVLAAVREVYWPVSGRTQVRRVIGECLVCFRADPKTRVTYMGDLPASRLDPARPFLQCGVDYAGPFFIKDRKTRGAKLTKAYICLFVCFVTKAIHLELVGDLTTDSFIAALRRFASRRGKPAQVYSDNGTNFIGAERELTELFEFIKVNENVIVERASSEGVQWHFIPPRAPHFGGLWEAGVKSTKTHLKRILASSNLVYEDFNTILVQVEGCLNSRPLCPLSEDPNDLQPLTPAHFLIGEPLTTIPDPDLLHLPENRLSKFQRLQQLTQHFWKRWSSEYLSGLQQRSKWWRNDPAQMKIGSLVILKDDNTAPAQWRVGRIVEAHPGKDGVSRVFTVRTATGLIKRAISKLCPFPQDEDSEKDFN